MNFPPVEGGKGDPSNTVGNPGQYLSISSKATAEAEGDRQEVLLHHACSTTTRSRAGSSPAACRSSRAATASSAASPDADFLKFVYDIASKRQGLRPVLGPGAEPDRGRDAAGQHRQAVPAADHPAAVGRQHERGHRQMTTLAPPAVRVQQSATRRGGRSGSVAWMALPALLMFVAFGVVPLLGVLALSFTTWDGIGAIHPSGLTSWRAVLTDPGLPHALWVTFLIMALSWAGADPAVASCIGVFLAGAQALPRVPGGALLHPAAAQLGGHRDHLQGAARPELRARRRPGHRRCSTRTGSATATSPSGVRRSSWCPGSSSRSTR